MECNYSSTHKAALLCCPSSACDILVQTLVRMCGSPVICVISVWCCHIFPLCECARQPLKAGRTIFTLSLCLPLQEVASLPLSFSPLSPSSLYNVFPRPVCTSPSNKFLSGFIHLSCSLLARARSFQQVLR